MIEGNTIPSRKFSVAELTASHLVKLGFNARLLRNHTNSKGHRDRVVIESEELGFIHVASISNAQSKSIQVYGNPNNPHLADKDYFAFGLNETLGYSIYFLDRKFVIGQSSISLEELKANCEKPLSINVDESGSYLKPAFVDQFSISTGVTQSTNITTSYVRSRLVRQSVLHRAQGHCEYCGEPGFVTNIGTQCLETHHIKPLSEGGPDTIENVIALCPTDHRKAHFEKSTDLTQAKLMEIVRRKSSIYISPINNA